MTDKIEVDPDVAAYWNPANPYDFKGVAVSLIYVRQNHHPVLTTIEWLNQEEVLLKDLVLVNKDWEPPWTLIKRPGTTQSNDKMFQLQLLQYLTRRKKNQRKRTLKNLKKKST